MDTHIAVWDRKYWQFPKKAKRPKAPDGNKNAALIGQQYALKKYTCPDFSGDIPIHALWGRR